MGRVPVNQPYSISQEFGVKDANALFGYHSGKDFAVGTGTPVFAPVAGHVVYAAEHSVRGKMVAIFDGQFYHRLMHNSAFNVGLGTQVTEGQQVALSGNTGLSTGPHVHWDINTRGVDAGGFPDFIDPDVWLLQQQTTEGDNDMSTQEATALLDELWWSFVGRKIKQSEIDEYVPQLLDGKYKDVMDKVSQFGETIVYVSRLLPVDARTKQLAADVQAVIDKYKV